MPKEPDFSLEEADLALEMALEEARTKKILKNIRMPKDGRDGEKGEQGVKGEKGEQGQNGKDGKNGRDGSDGRDGDNGLDGKQGKTGKTGAKGERGERGITGKTGKNGQDGQDGKDGADGRDGSSDSPSEIRNKLEKLKGNERLDASAIKNFRTAVTTITGGGTSILSMQIWSEVAGGSVNTFTLAYAPQLNTERVYARGQRLTVGAANDYTIAGGTITTANPWNAGDILVDYLRS